MMEETSYKETESTKVDYKKNKFGSIPEEWSVMRLDDVFDFLPTTSFSRNDLQHEATGIAYIHYGDIHATYDSNLLNIPECTDIPFLKENINLPKTVAYLKTGDLVVADASEDYAGVGACIEIICDSETKAISGLHTFALRPKEGLTAGGFRTYLLKHPRVGIELKKIVTGSKVYGLSKANFLKFEVVLPPLPEQHKIAEILSTWDRAIDTHTKLIEKKKERKKGLMYRLLKGKVRLSKFTEPWNDLSIQDFARVIRGASPRPKGDERYYGGKVPRLMVEDVTRDGRYVTPTTDFLTELGATKSRPCKAGTLTVVCSGDVGTPSFLAVDACIHDGFLGIIEINESIDANYLYSQLLLLKDRLERSATHGGVFTNLTTQILKEFKIPIPPKQEQIEIAATLDLGDGEIEKLEAQLEKLEEQKKGLMQKLLTGEIRVNQK